MTDMTLRNSHSNFILTPKFAKHLLSTPKYFDVPETQKN